MEPVENLTAALGKKHMIRSSEVVTTSEAQDKHLRAFEKGCSEWDSYHTTPLAGAELESYQAFVRELLKIEDFCSEVDLEKALKRIRKDFHMQPSKPHIVRAYHTLIDAGEVQKHPSFERVAIKKAVRSNSGVVVITVVTAPGTFSCPHDCHYCPDEPGQPRSYLSTEPAVARANQNEFDPVRQFYDRAGTLAKQGHTVDKVEIIVLGGTWSGYPREYQEEFCRDLFYAANTFDEYLSKLGGRGEAAAQPRSRCSILEEQQANEKAQVKIIGVTLETRPDYINTAEVRRLRRLGCTRVQIGVQHTDDQVLKGINRGHERKHAVSAVKLLKTAGFKVDIHLMPDLPGSDVKKDTLMFDEVLHGDELQADHWKIYPCEVTPFTKIEKWYQEGTYMPYTEKDPKLLIDLLAHVKSQVHPWIRLNRVIRDIPECSIIAGNSNTNLRQVIFAELAKMGKSCRCIRCREVRDWPEGPEKLRVRVREYRSSGGDEFFISIEGGPRGSGGGATQRALAGGKKATKKEKSQKKTSNRMKNFAGDAAVAAFHQHQLDLAREAEEASFDPDNAALYGLLRLRLNDDRHAAGKVFPELDDTALIRELHVYGVLVAARDGEAKGDGQAQHGGIGRTLMATAERLAAARGYRRIAVIAGVGVRNYYRKLGYEQTGEGQYLIKTALPATAPVTASDLERPFLEASAGLRRAANSETSRRNSCLGLTLGVALLGAASALAMRRR